MSYLNGNKFSLSEDSEFSSLSTFDVKPSINDSNYILIKLTGALDREKKRRLSELHIQVQQFLGDNTFKCRYEPTDIDRIREQTFIENVEVLSPLLKLPPSLKTQSHFEHHDEPKSVDLVLHQAADQSAEDLMQEISHITGIAPENMSVRADNSVIRAQISPKDLLQIAKIDSVGAIEEVHSLTLLNNVARDVIHADIGDSVAGSLTPYKGKDQVVTVADTGFDTGDKSDPHPAFANRVRNLIPVGRENSTSDPNGHGTHVCAAPEATLVVQALLAENGSLFGSSGKTLGDLLLDAYENHESRIHTNSWGPQWNWRGQLPYNNASEEIDKFVWDHQDLVVCFAAGNSGKQATPKGHIGAQPAAKNCITVGSCENPRSSKDYSCEVYDANGLVKGNPDNISGFSSRGPTMEGRIKPDVVAPGGMILSTASRAMRPENSFGKSDDKFWRFSSGTSMSTPLVAGCVAVLRQMLIANGLPNPSAALLKALLINGAVDTGKKRELQGFGRVDLARSMIIKGKTPNRDFLEAEVADEDLKDQFTMSFNMSRYMDDASPSSTLKVTMVYTDVAGALLQNNLNLSVTVEIPGQDRRVRYGNMGEQENIHPAPSDGVNTVEQIVWKDLKREATVTFTVLVGGTMMADVQPFALVWSVESDTAAK
ncbi:serine protease ABC transporter B family tagB [Penicillium maclennaniae]|uniref:serine protease ABC transporter B family tagB n=1 Tax=Penicillium maclennaniae TaxID=1343394 RepID=UPI0025405573|nr:serine protease ABC transporter B family tagB [Penicillium maclennaniae]KAJ5674629.1 serine protease ABC transporter B family tagB [Penicillium maclennaniae]